MKKTTKTAAQAVTVALPVSPEMKSLVEQIGGAVSVPVPAHKKSAKQFIRETLSVEGAKLTVEEMCKQSGCTPVNIRTMLSDLRSPKYAGKAGVFITKSVRDGDKTYYMKATPAAQ